MKTTPLDRILLFITGLLAAYQVAVGINGLDTIPIIAYTIAFGVLLVAGLLLIILGYEVLESPIVVIVSTVIPLALSLGLIWEHLTAYRIPYLFFVNIGFLAVVITRSLPMPEKVPIFVIAIVHGIPGLTIFLLPSILASNGSMRPGFALVGLGGALIGILGLLLSFLKTGRPIYPRETMLKVFPGLLSLMAACFVAGFALG